VVLSFAYESGWLHRHPIDLSTRRIRTRESVTYYHTNRDLKMAEAIQNSYMYVNERAMSKHEEKKNEFDIF
jgi:hypothetical protein